MIPYTHNIFQVGSDVFHISRDTGVLHGIVKTISITIHYSGPDTVSYNVAYVDSTRGSVTDVEDNFADTVQGALTLYQQRYLTETL